MTPSCILFVCTGNTCRSPMAEALLRHKLAQLKREDVRIFSRGMTAGERSVTQEVREVLLDEGVEIGEHRSKLLMSEDVQAADLILVMEKIHLDAIRKDHPQAAAKTFLLKEYTGLATPESAEIPDPYGQSLLKYDQCKIEIQNCLTALIHKLEL